MVTFVQPILADALLNGVAFLAVVLVGYLLWLRVHEKRQERRLQKERERNRRKHWGYV